MENEIRIKPNIKQYEALEYLSDKTTNEILYGGGASGGKTWLGCAWIIMSVLQYPGSRYMIGRSKLNTLKTTTLKTFNDILKKWNISERFKINHQTNTISVDNGSEILLKDLFAYPSDPQFDSLGSLEITGCFIDEISQISFDAFDIIKTRIRYKHSEFGIEAKILMTCNPSKGWIYNRYYKPFTENNLSNDIKFIPALAKDNPNTEPGYITMLEKASDAAKQRLLYGNWDYSDDIDTLFKYTDLLKIKDITSPIEGKRYISGDIARFGNDKTIFMVWEGLTIIDIVELNQVGLDESTAKLKEISNIYQIPLSHIILDADGVGGGAVDFSKGVVSFVNGSSPIYIGNDPQIFTNLKSQCYYKLADLIEKQKIKLKNLSDSVFESLCQELQIIKQKDIDKDSKLAVIPKDVMKKVLGRSPDYADAMMMRMYFEVKNIPIRTPMRF